MPPPPPPGLQPGLGSGGQEEGLASGGTVTSLLEYPSIFSPIKQWIPPPGLYTCVHTLAAPHHAHKHGPAGRWAHASRQTTQAQIDPLHSANWRNAFVRFPRVRAMSGGVSVIFCFKEKGILKPIFHWILGLR